MPLACALPTSGQSQIPPKAESQPAALIHSVEGPDLFLAYCASCHGTDAKGTGPAAASLKVSPPDLTIMAANHHGKFTAVRVREMILGDKPGAHGSREMPVWGPIFHQVESDMDWGNVRLENLVKYLQSVQVTKSSALSSGAELYQRHCAVCHGNDLKGTGP